MTERKMIKGRMSALLEERGALYRIGRSGHKTTREEEAVKKNSRHGAQPTAETAWSQRDGAGPRRGPRRRSLGGRAAHGSARWAVREIVHRGEWRAIRVHGALGAISGRPRAVEEPMGELATHPIAGLGATIEERGQG